jgi:hypothetical protein
VQLTVIVLVDGLYEIQEEAGGVALAAVEDDEADVEPEPDLSLSSLIKGLASVSVVALSLIAVDSCMNNGGTLNGVYWDISGALSAKARIMMAKANQKWSFNSYYQKLL